MKIFIRLSLILLVMVQPGWSQKIGLGVKLNGNAQSDPPPVLRPASNDSISTTNRNVFKDIGTYIKIYLQDGWYLATSPVQMNRRQMVRLGSILAAGSLIYAYDKSLLENLQQNKHRNGFKQLGKFGNRIEPYGLAKTLNPYYIAGAISGYIFRIQPLEAVSIQLHEALFLGALFRKAVVHLTGRTRPYEKKGTYFFKFNQGSSFFSGHTANAFELATILSQHIQWSPFTWLAYSLATTIGIQRLYADSHWPSDVFSGAVYGIAIGKVIVHLHKGRDLKVTLGMTPAGPGFVYSF